MPTGKPLKTRELDDKDKKILMLLQKDGRIQLNKIAKEVNLSIDSVNNRIKEMQRRNVFRTGIFINPRNMGYPLLADIKIKIKNVSQEERNKFVNYLLGYKKCFELLSIMGDYDFTCVFYAKDSNELEEISIHIREKFKDLISDWNGLLVLKTYKLEYFDLI